MQKIHCKSQSCIHNDDERCSADTILVKGGFAEKSENTYCDSYNDDAGSYILKEAEGAVRGRNVKSLGRWLDTEFASEHEHSGTQINCTASKCSFNDEYRCTAGKITINDPSVNPKGRSECKSFRPGR
ncbi:MAG: DUF1540 domain-containing protein [Christensenellales bacterium]|jgi:hypothetical protein